MQLLSLVGKYHISIKINKLALLEGIQILVVDDNPLNLKIACFILQKSGAQTASALNGFEAIKMVQQNSYDLILMDLQMPEMDGYEATEFIRQELRSSIPIIGLSANIMFGEEEKCTEIGMNGYLTKPFEQADLSNLILKTLKRI